MSYKTNEELDVLQCGMVGNIRMKAKGMVAHPLEISKALILESVVEIHVDLGGVLP